MLGFYLVYFIFFNSGLNIYLPEHKNSDLVIKRKLIDNYCFLIIGGSNVRTGISAKLLSENICPTLNLGITNELAYFDLYLDWLASNTIGRKYNYVLYSPRIFWSDSLITKNDSNFINFPKISIFTQLKNIIIDSRSIVNSYGDVESYTCNLNITSFNINKHDFEKYNNIIAQEIKQRLSLLRDIASNNNLYVRVPPVYVKTEEQAQTYIKLMNKRIEILNGFGIKIIGTTIVSTDSSLFCDSFHPNSKGRELFTKEIRLP
jgi:hypothetical protein